MSNKKIYLTLQNGKTFEGYAFGAEGEREGELVFTTGMVGYIETLTDPCNCGQIVVQSFPLIGNYGIIRADEESENVSPAAYVVREICDEPSNFRSEGDLASYLKERGVVGICGVDTRELTKILRAEGTMKGRISRKPLREEEVKALALLPDANELSSLGKQEKAFYETENARYTIALWNFGAKRSTIEKLLSLGANVLSFPADATAEEILASGAHGVVLSEGPGNAAKATAIVEEVKKVLGEKPMLGLGLGHQLLALALGGKIEKLKYGHRGGNQPVKCVADGRVYVSVQNHAYAVVGDSLKGAVSFVNVNDGSCEGLERLDEKALGVQFTLDCLEIGNEENPIFAQFMGMMEKEKENA